MRIRRTVIVLTVLLAGIHAASARWQGPKDNKSFSELRAMSPDELFNESFDVCIRRAMFEKSAATDPDSATEVTVAGEYLEILDVAAAAQYAGTAPAWMKQLAASHTVKDCQGAFHTYLQGSAPPPAATPTARRQAARVGAVAPPRRVVRTPKPRISGATEELPPWLAPATKP
jgi:hypothetical protein